MKRTKPDMIVTRHSTMESVQCPRCGQPPLSTCRSPSGRPCGAPHRERIDAWASMAARRLAVEENA
jgi:hypothetical protein